VPAQDWNRRDGEPAKAYAAFSKYRDLGPDRSLNAAYQVDSGLPASVRAPGYWAEWSSAWEWVERAAAYDAYLDEVRRSAREAKLRELEARRSEYEYKNQIELERIADELTLEMREAIRAGFTEVEEEGVLVDGQLVTTKRKTKVKFPAFGSIARLVKERNETARQAIEGPQLRPGEADKPGDAPAAVSEIAWVPPTKDEGEK
jgi:hypothetical protein